MYDGKRADVLQGAAYLVTTPHSPDQERGLADQSTKPIRTSWSIGPTVFANLLALLRAPGDYTCGWSDRFVARRRPAEG
jgi:hypothetical protein